MQNGNKPQTEDTSNKNTRFDLKGLRTYKKDVLDATSKNNGANGVKDAQKTALSSIKLKMPEIDGSEKLKSDRAPKPPTVPSRISVVDDSTLAEEIALAEKIRSEAGERQEERMNIERAEKRRKEREEKERVLALKNKEMRAIAEKKEAEERKKKIAERKIAERKEIISKIEEIIRINTSLEEERRGFVSEKNDLEKILKTVVIKEESIESDVSNIEKEEASEQNPDKHKELDKKRWAIEESRRKIEKERWDIEKNIETVSSSIKEKDAVISDNNEKMRTLALRKKELDNEDKRREFEQLLKNISKTKEAFEIEWINLSDKKKALDEKMSAIAKRENDLTAEKIALEEKEKASSGGEEKRNYEQKRWGVEEAKRKTEEEKWILDDMIKKIESEIVSLKPKYQEAMANEEDIKRKLKEVS